MLTSYFNNLLILFQLKRHLATLAKHLFTNFPTFFEPATHLQRNEKRSFPQVLSTYKKLPLKSSMIAKHSHLTQKPLYIKDLMALLHHAARRLLECNIVNIECKKCGKSTFWMFLSVTSLTGIYRFL